MNQESRKKKIKSRISAYRLKPEQVHKNIKAYNRKKSKKETWWLIDRSSREN